MLSMMVNLLFAMAMASAAQSTKIGAHYTDGLAGLAVYQDAKHSLLLDFAWQGTDFKMHRGYKALMDAAVHFGDAAPDDSYHRITWTAGKTPTGHDIGLFAQTTSIKPTIIT